MCSLFVKRLKTMVWKEIVEFWRCNKSRRSENDDWGRNGTIYSYLFLWWQGNSWKEFSLPLVTCIKWKYKENQEQKMVHCQHCHRVWTVWVKKAKLKKYTVAHFQYNPRETILIAFETRCNYFYNITKIRIQLVIVYLILDIHLT